MEDPLKGPYWGIGGVGDIKGLKINIGRPWDDEGPTKNHARTFFVVYPTIQLIYWSHFRLPAGSVDKIW